MIGTILSPNEAPGLWVPEVHEIEIAAPGGVWDLKADASVESICFEGSSLVIEFRHDTLGYGCAIEWRGLRRVEIVAEQLDKLAGSLGFFYASLIAFSSAELRFMVETDFHEIVLSCDSVHVR